MSDAKGMIAEALSGKCSSQHACCTARIDLAVEMEAALAANDFLRAGVNKVMDERDTLRKRVAELEKQLGIGIRDLSDSISFDDDHD